MFRLEKKFLSRDHPPNKVKIFWHQIWLHTCSECKKIFCPGNPPLPVKGKIFDTRFGLIHVQTGKKFFVEGPPPPGIARTCFGYVVGGMPFAFTQEDFLVWERFELSRIHFRYFLTRNVGLQLRKNVARIWIECQGSMQKEITTAIVLASFKYASKFVH